MSINSDSIEKPFSSFRHTESEQSFSVRNKMNTKPNVPAREFILAQAHLEAILTRVGRCAAFGEAVQLVVLHSIDAPCTRAWSNAQT